MPQGPVLEGLEAGCVYGEGQQTPFQPAVDSCSVTSTANSFDAFCVLGSPLMSSKVVCALWNCMISLIIFLPHFCVASLWWGARRPHSLTQPNGRYTTRTMLELSSSGG